MLDFAALPQDAEVRKRAIAAIQREKAAAANAIVAANADAGATSDAVARSSPASSTAATLRSDYLDGINGFKFMVGWAGRWWTLLDRRSSLPELRARAWVRLEDLWVAVSMAAQTKRVLERARLVKAERAERARTNPALAEEQDEAAMEEERARGSQYDEFIEPRIISYYNEGRITTEKWTYEWAAPTEEEVAAEEERNRRESVSGAGTPPRAGVGANVGGGTGLGGEGGVGGAAARARAARAAKKAGGFAAVSEAAVALTRTHRDPLGGSVGDGRDWAVLTKLTREAMAEHEATLS